MYAVFAGYGKYSVSHADGHGLRSSRNCRRKPPSTLVTTKLPAENAVSDGVVWESVSPRTTYDELGKYLLFAKLLKIGIRSCSGNITESAMRSVSVVKL